LTLRTRVVLGFAGTLALMLALFSAALYAGMAYALYREVDRDIAGRAADVARFVRVVPRAHLQARLIRLPNVEVFSAPDLFIQVLDPAGTPVARSANLGDRLLPPAGALPTQGQYVTASVDGVRLRMYSVPLFVNERPALIVQTARSLRDVDFTLRRLRRALVTGSLLMVLVSAAVVAWLTSAFVNPLARITRTAMDIEASGDLRLRVDYRGPPDEVGRFAAAFNAMLERLEQAYNRLNAAYEAQRRFLADVSHQLRSPLTVIRGNVELIRRARRESPSRQQPALEAALEDTHAAATHLSRLVDGLLTLARAETGQPLAREPVPLAEVLDEAARQGRRLAQGRRFRVAGLEAAEGRVVAGHRDYLVQLFLILLENAAKYTPPGGSILLEVAGGDREVRVTVADTGIGIRPEHLPHIFERFYRAPDASGTDGTGLGLAIGRWIAEQHGGTIAVESEPGRGSRFTVTLPVAAGQPGPTGAP